MSPQAIAGMNEVWDRLGRLRKSIRLLFAGDGISRLILALVTFIFLTFGLDYGLSLPAFVRITLLLIGLGAFGWVVAKRIVYPLSVPVSDDDLALFVERNYPELSDRLISAIQLSREAHTVPSGDAAARDVAYNSPELVDALIAEAREATAPLDFKRVLLGDHVRKVALWAAGLTALIVGLAVWQPVYASIYFKRMLGGGDKWPQRIELKVVDFDPATRRRVIARGDDLVIAVQVVKKVPGAAIPDDVELKYHYIKSGEFGTVRLEPITGEQFKTPAEAFSRVTGAFEFTVEGGDDKTEVYTVDTLNPPSIEEIRLYYEFPKYLRKQDTPENQPILVGNVLAPMRTHVRFTAHANDELSEGSMSIGLKGKETTTPLKVAPDDKGLLTRISGDFEVRDEYSEWSLVLTAKNGLKNRDPIRYTIRGKKDEPPKIHLDPYDPLSEEDVTEVCVRPIRFSVEDDYGIAEIAVTYRVLGTNKSAEWQTVKLARENIGGKEYGELKLDASYDLDFAKLKVVPGDTVELKLLASDYKDYDGGNHFVSPLYSFHVKTMSEIDAALQRSIDEVKLILERQRGREERTYQRTEEFMKKYGTVDAINAEQSGEIRNASLEQNEIVQKLDVARKDLARIMRRGLYNKVYDELAAAKLNTAIEILTNLAGEPNNMAKPGLASIAVSHLTDAATSRAARARYDHLHDASNEEDQTIEGIKKALDALEKWANYQEIVRSVREILEAQKTTNKHIPDIKEK